MKIKSIDLKHTNPSLGPHEKITTVSLSVTERHLERVDEFLNQSQVNNTVSLYEYLKAVKTKNEEVLNRVFNNEPKNELNSGQKISHLLFYFEDNEIIELSDVYRRFSLSHFYADFTNYMVEEGTIYHTKSDESPIFLKNKKGNL